MKGITNQKFKPGQFRRQKLNTHRKQNEVDCMSYEISALKKWQSLCW